MPNDTLSAPNDTLLHPKRSISPPIILRENKSSGAPKKEISFDWLVAKSICDGLHEATKSHRNPTLNFEKALTKLSLSERLTRLVMCEQTSRNTLQNRNANKLAAAEPEKTLSSSNNASPVENANSASNGTSSQGSTDEGDFSDNELDSAWEEAKKNTGNSPSISAIVTMFSSTPNQAMHKVSRNNPTPY